MTIINVGLIGVVKIFMNTLITKNKVFQNKWIPKQTMATIGLNLIETQNMKTKYKNMKYARKK